METDNLLTVALDTVNEELMQEGLAREFVNKVQNMRKEKNLDVMDRIVTRYRGSRCSNLSSKPTRISSEPKR